MSQSSLPGPHPLVDLGEDLGCDIDEELGEELVEDLGYDIGEDLGDELVEDLGEDVCAFFGENLGEDHGVDYNQTASTPSLLP